MKYEMKLDNEPFKAIKNGTKTLELRLNDEKRKLLTVGDYIEFTNRVVKVIDLFKYNSFEELYKHFNKIEMGYSINEEANPKDMENYYSKEEQEKYGVLGIKIKELTK